MKERLGMSDRNMQSSDGGLLIQFDPKYDLEAINQSFVRPEETL
jgi:hypothetical protein